MAYALSKLYLFGGDRPWSPIDWTASDDRVRGGSSFSELLCSPSEPIAIFRGNLDTKTLGGAGFASQRTTGEDRSWDLSNYDGIMLDITKSDDKMYTLLVKDELLPKSPNGREQSTISWEYDFKPEKDGEKVYVHWDDLKATYRGREKKDVQPLDLKNVKRISLMMRSFFGAQEGDFSLSITSISAFKKSSTKARPEPYRDDPNRSEGPISFNPETAPRNRGQREGWLGWLFGFCVGS